MSEDTTVKTTAEHFRVFRRTFLDCCEGWGISGWRIDFLHKNDGRDYAGITTELQNYIAIVTLCQDWHVEPIPLTEETVKERARHEAVHLLLAELDCLAKWRHSSKFDLDSAEERLCRKLQELLP